MPIKDGEGNVLAVAQVMNKQQAGSEESNLVFSKQDVSLFRAYTNFCGIGLYQARILFRSQLETRRSQVNILYFFLYSFDLSRPFIKVNTDIFFIHGCDKINRVRFVDFRRYDSGNWFSLNHICCKWLDLLFNKLYYTRMDEGRNVGMKEDREKRG